MGDGVERFRLLAVAAGTGYGDQRHFHTPVMDLRRGSVNYEERLPWRSLLDRGTEDCAKGDEHRSEAESAGDRSGVRSDEGDGVSDRAERSEPRSGCRARASPGVRRENAAGGVGGQTGEGRRLAAGGAGARLGQGFIVPSPAMSGQRTANQNGCNRIVERILEAKTARTCVRTVPRRMHVPLGGWLYQGQRRGDSTRAALCCQH